MQAEFAHNNRKHSATKMSPFFAVYGRHLNGFEDLETELTNLDSEEFAEHLKETHLMAKAALDKASRDMKKYHDRRVQQLQVYQAGDKVFLEG